MPANPSGLAPRLTRHCWLLLAMVLIAPAYLFWTTHTEIGSFADDGPAYLMMARHYSPFLAESRVNALFAATSRFPPLYPLLLALTGAGKNMLCAHLLTTLFLLAGLVVYYFWLRERGLPAAGSASLMLLVALMPGSWLSGLQIQSEYLYLLLSLLSLWLLECHRRTGTDELLYAAALAISLTALTRTIGVVLFAPLLVAATRSSRRSGLLALLMALLPIALWHLLHRSTQSYLGDLRGIYGHAPWSALVVQAHRELPALQSGWIGNLEILPVLPPLLVEALGLLCLAGAMLRAARLETDGLYVVLYFAVVCIWPYPDETARFLWAITPPALAQLPWITAAGAFRDRSTAHPGMLACLALLMLAMSLPGIGMAVARYHDAALSPNPIAKAYRNWYLPDLSLASHAVNSELTIMTAMSRIHDETPAGACVIAVRPDLVNFYADRPGIRPPLNSVPDPAFQASLFESGCRYVFMSSMLDSIYPVPLHPLQRLQGMISVLDHVDVADPAPGRANAVAVLGELQLRSRTSEAGGSQQTE